MEADISFCDIRRREVINGSDGRRLGHITDIIFGV
ncbi:MAG: PRC-barrel domain-containing protein, partial [Clostridiales bacterium]|nr:PRC-barrel domain-containing protein [Clostridiales bacterium]